MISDATRELRFRETLAELIDENVLACSAILSLAAVRFTREIPTLCVSCEARPVLSVNPDFLREHTSNDTDVKAVILHEFLHVLLGHTFSFGASSRAQNIAFDAVINHIIQREFGEEYGKVFRRYYKRAKGITALLGPWTRPQLNRHWRSLDPLISIRRKLQWGKVIAEDVFDLIEQLESERDGTALPKKRYFIGNHAGPSIPWESLSRELSTAISHTQRSLAGQGILGESDMEAYTRLHEDAKIAGASPVKRWEQETLALIERCITPDRRAVPERKPLRAHLPVLHPGARRATLQTLWNPLLPDVPWELATYEPAGTCQVYLDVSGSMVSVMPPLIALLRRFGSRIRQPFWGFSTEVTPAKIVHGKLECGTTGGTAIGCVLEHVRATRPKRALIITDGHVEHTSRSITSALQADGQALHALITHDGDSRRLESIGIPCHQLSVRPEGRR